MTVTCIFCEIGGQYSSYYTHICVKYCANLRNVWCVCFNNSVANLSFICSRLPVVHPVICFAGDWCYIIFNCAIFYLLEFIGRVKYRPFEWVPENKEILCTCVVIKRFYCGYWREITLYCVTMRYKMKQIPQQMFTNWLRAKLAFHLQTCQQWSPCNAFACLLI